MLQHVKTLSHERVDIAAANLAAGNLQLDSALPQVTFLSQEGKVDDALRILDDTLAKSANDFPELHAYALLQKAALLRQQQKSNALVINELAQFLSSHPDVETAFDQVFSGKAREALALATVQ